MKHIILSILLWIISPGLNAELLLKADQNQVNVGQTFRLIISTDTATNSYPELTSLAKDFTIVGTEQSTSYNIYNGQTSAFIRWVVLVIPKHAGDITISPLSVGHEHTNALVIHVNGRELKKTDNQSLPNDDVMLTAKIDKKDHYINEQLLYTVKLYTNKQLLNVTYQEPHMKEGLVISLGDSGRYQEIRKGILYTVEEQHYAFFPQKSGNIIIDPPIIKAVTYEGMAQPLQITTKPITVLVKPIPPANKNNPWLPAVAATLTESYDKPLTNLHEGDTLVRTVTLKVKGFPAQLLPNITFDESPGLSIYSTTPKLKSKLVNGELVSEKSIDVTYLFNKGLQVTIPGITLNWFNTATNQLETLSLPQANIILQQHAYQSTPLSPPPKKAALSSSKIQPHSATWSFSFLLYLAAVFGCGGLATYLWMRRKITPSLEVETKPYFSLKQLKEACLSHDMKAAKDSLLLWAANMFPDREILNLTELARVIEDNAIREELVKLNKALYYLGDTQWQGFTLWKLISEYKLKSNKKKAKKIELPEL